MQHGPHKRGYTMSRKYLTQGLFVSFMAVALATGCAGPSASSPDKIQRALALDTRDSVDQYVLGATDVVRVSVWRNEDLSISVPVRPDRSEEHTSELQSRPHLVCRLLLEK